MDFGLGAPIVDEQGKRTRTWVPRMVLSHSRNGYSEAVLRQDIETFNHLSTEEAKRPFWPASLRIGFGLLGTSVNPSSSIK